MPETETLGLVTGTYYITFYMSDGSVISYDLTDPRVPLPTFRSLVTTQAPATIDAPPSS